MNNLNQPQKQTKLQKATTFQPQAQTRRQQEQLSQQIYHGVGSTDPIKSLPNPFSMHSKSMWIPKSLAAEWVVASEQVEMRTWSGLGKTSTV
ncbi:unnamed protein product [Ambrosiozyma monospora]|uniref:Unnamed protein product n=1 Tax=Ambrosiozyma monospora TaxID=43982 RepID=A0A9W6WM30_AMBMO|nr:unnamed protein product [Ambrosiozyma monospora]